MSLLAAFSREPHHLDHLLPVWAQVPDQYRGPVIVPDAMGARVTGRRPRVLLDTPGSAVQLRHLMDRNPELVTLVSSWGSLRPILGRPTVFMEHGLGQSYEGVRNPSYCNSGRRSGVRLFLVPNHVAARQVRAANPNHPPPVVVGVPRLDGWHLSPVKPQNPKPTVAVTFHWRCNVAPETQPALDEFLPAVKRLAKRKTIRVIGHGHPRLWGEIAPIWERLGVEAVRDSEEVLARADCLIADNTSFLYEFASLDRPVVVLDPSHYRRDVHHGLRFWEAADVGVRVSDPKLLSAAVDAALEDAPALRDRRREVLDLVMPYRDGRSATRAANAIVDVLRAAS